MTPTECPQCKIEMEPLTYLKCPRCYLRLTPAEAPRHPSIAEQLQEAHGWVKRFLDTGDASGLPSAEARLKRLAASSGVSAVQIDARVWRHAEEDLRRLQAEKKALTDALASLQERHDKLKAAFSENEKLTDSLLKQLEEREDALASAEADRVRLTNRLIAERNVVISAIREVEQLQHAPPCNSRWASTCGDSQRCNCGLEDVLTILRRAEKE